MEGSGGIGGLTAILEEGPGGQLLRTLLFWFSGKDLQKGTDLQPFGTASELDPNIAYQRGYLSLWDYPISGTNGPDPTWVTSQLFFTFTGEAYVGALMKSFGLAASGASQMTSLRTTAAPNILRSVGSGGSIVEARKLEILFKFLRSKGVGIMQGEEADRLLSSIGAKAAYWPKEGGPGTLILPSNVTRGMLAEEVLHYVQYRNAGSSLF